VLLELDDDQRFWRETVQEAAAKQCPPSLVRQIAEGTTDAGGLWKWYVDQGWTELTTSKNFVELVLVLEELGRATDPTPYLASMTQFAPLVGDRFDPKLIGAAVYGGVTAHRQPDGWVVNGTARFVLDGDRADRLAVITAAGVFIIDAADVIARRTAVFDPVLHVADLLFSDVRVAEENRVSTDAERAWHIALTGMAMHVAIERARALSFFSALTIVADDPRRRLSAAMAKAAAGEAQSLVVQQGMQSFGAMGVTWENDLQFAIKRAKAGELMLGGAAEHRALIAKEYCAADF
jgi:hypothetical protein